MLEKFKEENKRKKPIIIFTILCVFLIVGAFMYQSFALFETNEQFNIVTGSVENPGDIAFTFYIKDEISLEAPKSDSGLALDEKSSCTNGVNVSWNVEMWNAKLDYSNYKQENTSKVKCNLYFRDADYADYVTSCGQNNTSATECMKKYSDKDTANLAYDETTDNNLRYIGATPNNYVWFNEELWRIIGVMNNIKKTEEDVEGQSRLKIIRNESIGKYSWDSSASTINDGYGVNEWTASDMNELLNEYYYNSKSSSKCYVERYNSYTSCDFSKIGIKDISKEMIDDVIWNLGSNGTNDYYTTRGLVTHFYEYERSKNVRKYCTGGELCNDTESKNIVWQGKIGLAYPSDYGYATSGESETDRKRCWGKTLYQWDDFEKACPINDWMGKEGHIWLITPFAYSDSSFYAFVIGGDGVYLSNTSCSTSYETLPTIYLKTNIKITSGTGTKENPYRLSEK